MIASRMPSLVTALAVAVLAALTLAAAAPQQAGSRGGPAYVVPPADEGRRIEARQGVVSSANALASDAGVEMLGAGGNAVDAAVAAAFAIGVVEPQMSGLGGSGAATVWLQREGQVHYLDFYAAQPVESWRGHTGPASPAIRGGGQAGNAPGQVPRPPGGAALVPPSPEQEMMAAFPRREPGDLQVVGVPGEVAGLLALHERFGRLPLAQVMQPAIRLAEEGFPVAQMLATYIASSAEKMKPFPAATAIYLPGGRPLGPGEVLRNPELAASLRRVAAEGRRGFYEGPTAEALVAALNAGRHPLSRDVLRGYEPQWKRPLCTDYRGLTVLSAPPPQTGLQVLHTLELLEPFDLKALGLPTQSAAAFDVLVSAMRAGQASTRGNGDPNWVPVPARGLSSAAFAESRSGLVGTGAAAKTVEPVDARAFDQAPPAGACGTYDPYGTATAIPGGETGWNPGGNDAEGERAADDSGETTHLSVVDRDGNAVSLTQTNSSVFGSGGFVAGFFLNDSGFRFTDENIGAPSRSPWRIRTTTISPTILLKDGRVQMVIGAPGGGRIPTEIVQVMVYVLDYGLDPLDAVRIPRIFPSAANVRVQVAHGFTPQVLREFRVKGYDPTAESIGYARLYLIVRRGDRWIGVADPGHDGQPRGY